MLKGKEVFIIALITLFYVVNFMVIRKQVVHFPTSSLSVFMYNSIPDMAGVISSRQWGELFPAMIRSEYPPVFTLTGALLASFVSKSWLLVTLLSNSFYLVMLLVFSVLTGTELKDRETGLMSALLVVLYPLTYMIFNTGFPMDFPLLGLTLMSFYFLIKSEYFTKTAWTLLYSLACVWGMLMKDPFAAFMAGPLLYGAYSAGSKALKGEYTPLRNLALCLLIIGTMIYPYYLDNCHAVVRRVYGEPGRAPWYDYSTLRYFTTGLWEQQLSLPFFLLLVPGLYYFFTKPLKVEARLPVLFWIIIPNLVILLMPHWKSSRHFLPQLPALALVSAVGLRNLIDIKGVNNLFLAVIGFGIYQYYDFTYDLGPLSRMKIGAFEYYTGTRDSVQFFPEMVKESTEIKALLRCIDEEAQNFKRTYGKSPSLVVIPALNGAGKCYDLNFRALCWFNEVRGNAYSLRQTISRKESVIPSADLLVTFSDRNEVTDLGSASYLSMLMDIGSGVMPAGFDSMWRKQAAEFSPEKVVEVNDKLYICFYRRIKNIET